MEFVIQYSLFLAKVATFVIALLLALSSIIAIIMRAKKPGNNELRITLLNEEFEHMEHAVSSAQLIPAIQKQRAKATRRQEKKQARQKAKLAKKQARAQKSDKHRAAESSENDTDTRKRLFVIDFDGDIRASANDSMRHEISAILINATQKDEVLLRLESGGGMVHSYGLAASQLQRLRDHDIPLTIAVDKIAASGGYMMACVANKIIAAPFSLIGSIGVLAQLPNLHRLLKDNKIDYEQLSAGEFKRTLTIFGENTDKQRQKMQQEIEETHQHFKDFIRRQRPGLDVDAVATGEHWLGTRALELGLIDVLQTSDDYLMAARNECDLLHLEYSRRKTLRERIGELFASVRRQQQQSIEDMERHLLM